MSDARYAYSLTTAAEREAEPCRNEARYRWRLWMLDVPILDRGERIPFRDRQVVEVCRSIVACGPCTGLSKRQRTRVARGLPLLLNGAEGEAGTIRIEALCPHVARR